MELYNNMPESCGFFCENSMSSIEFIDKSLVNAQKLLFNGEKKPKKQKDQASNVENINTIQRPKNSSPVEEKLSKQQNPSISVKEKIHCKLFNIPACYETTIKTVRNIDVFHINRLIVVKGTALRCGTRKNREISKEFKCRMCDAKFMAYTDIYQFNAYKLPPRCKNIIERQKSNFFHNLMEKAYGKKKETKKNDEDFKKSQPAFTMVKGECGSKSFSGVEGTATYIDYQEIRLQETFRTLKPGVIPRAITVILQVFLLKTYFFIRKV